MSTPKPSGRPAAASLAARPAAKDFLNDWALALESATPGAWRSVALPAALFGIAFAILYVISYFLLANTPLGSATDAEIIAYYADGTNLTLTLAGMLIMPFAGIAFLYFMVLLRLLASKTGFPISRMLSNVQLAAGTVFIAMLFVATAALVATPAGIRFADAQTDPIVARMLPMLSTTVLLMFGMRMASMFVFTSSSIGRGAGIIPGWFGWLGYAVGVLLLLSATFSAWFALLFPVWVIALCIIILLRRARGDSD